MLGEAHGVEAARANRCGSTWSPIVTRSPSASGPSRRPVRAGSMRAPAHRRDELQFPCRIRTRSLSEGGAKMRADQGLRGLSEFHTPTRACTCVGTVAPAITALPLARHWARLVTHPSTNNAVGPMTSELPWAPHAYPNRPATRSGLAQQWSCMRVALSGGLCVSADEHRRETGTGPRHGAMGIPRRNPESSIFTEGGRIGWQ